MRFFHLLALLLPLVLNAQLFEGQKFVGGALEFRAYQSDSDIKRISLGTDLTVGKMFSERFAFGVVVGLMLEQQKSLTMVVQPSTGFPIEFENLYKESGIKIEPIFSWYWPVVGERWYFNLLTGLGVQLERTKRESFSFLSEDKQTELSWRISPSIYYFVSEKIALEASIGELTYSYALFENEFDSSNLNLSLSSTLSIGVQYFFGKQKE